MTAAGFVLHLLARSVDDCSDSQFKTGPQDLGVCLVENFVLQVECNFLEFGPAQCVEKVVHAAQCVDVDWA
eukprot:3941780-Rhodomonas_salina.1